MIGPEATEGEWALGIFLAIVFFIVYGVLYWLVADHVWPRIACAFAGHEPSRERASFCSRCGKKNLMPTPANGSTHRAGEDS